MPALMVQQTRADTYTVTVSTNKAVYNPGETVTIIVEVKKGAILIGGANVGVTIEYPGGGVTGGSAVAIALGLYRYQYNLSPTAGGGLYKVTASASKASDSGSGNTNFTVAGTPAKKTVDWAVYNPSNYPANPTSASDCRLRVELRMHSDVEN